MNNNGWTFEESKLLDDLLKDPELMKSLDIILRDTVKENESGQSDDGWTFEDNKIFEGLLEDPKLIESPDTGSKDNVKEDESGPSKKRKITKRPRARVTPWTHEEHKLFLSGLQEFGKGKWKAISNVYVNTKTPTQIASHAQKFINRVHSRTPLDKRRRSINDIRSLENSSSSTYKPSHISPRESVPQNYGPPTIRNLAFNNIDPQSNVPQDFVPVNFQHLALHQVQQPHVFPTNNYRNFN